MSNDVISIGIDLGTTFSLVARLDSGGNPQIIKGDSHMRSSLPSVISFEEDEPLIGELARNSRGSQNTFSMFKRDMGLTKEEIEQENEGTYPYQVKKESGPNKQKIYTPVELSAMILDQLTKWVGMEVPAVDIGDVVITVPAHFGEKERVATTKAAEQAGLKNVSLINEPTAAAIYYSVLQDELPKGVFAVFDLGGGTFDVTILRTDAEGNLEELVTKGDHHLGGEDFDRALQELVKEKYLEATGEEITDEDIPLDTVEEAKIQLGERDQWVFRVMRENITVTRDDFEQKINIPLTQAGELCSEAFEEAKQEYDVSEVDYVLLAGGSSRIPMVRQVAEHAFDKEPEVVGNVDEVVAMGAVLYSAIKGDKKSLTPAQREKFENLTVQMRTQRYYGSVLYYGEESEFEGGLQVKVVIPRGTKIPHSNNPPMESYTIVDGQQTIHITITESEDEVVNPKFATTITEGKFELSPPYGPAGTRKFETTFTYDASQRMRCEVKDVQSGAVWEALLDVSF